MDESACRSLLAVPKDFQVTRETNGVCHVHYRHAGANGLSWLVFVGGAVWMLAGAIVLLAEAAQHAPLLGIAMCLVTLGVLGAAGVVMLRLVRLLCGRKCFTATSDGLEVTSRLFRWSRSQRIPWEQIERFRLLKDRWERSGSRYGWALVVETPRPITLLSGQQASRCRWLGEWLSRWSGKEFCSDIETPTNGNHVRNRSAPSPAEQGTKTRRRVPITEH